MPGDVIAEHVNNEVDVLPVVVSSVGEVAIDGTLWPLHVGRIVVVPRGAARSLRCTDKPLVYVSCRQRRSALVPA